MKKIRHFILLFAVFAVGGNNIKLHADEGMWMLNKIDQKTAEVMKGLGLQLTPDELYDPDGVSLKDAVVDFGDFCTGVVVSPQGLVFTNHHCGYGSIQKLSTPEDDILKNGFVAHRFSEERPAKGLFVRFLQRTEECSERVMQALDSLYRAMPDMEAKEIDALYLDSICIAVERDFSVANPGLDCQVKNYYGGNAFYVSFYKVYNDIRLVFTAPESLGRFGGDTDNWVWPRQTSDFSVFRIYADKNGEPAEYSEENVPYQAKRYAKVCMDGYRPGDYCMTVGYPGSTDRYLSSWGIRERVDTRNISTIQVRGRKQDVWKTFMDKSRSIALKYASKWMGSSNYWKNSIGMNKAVAELDVIGQKQQLEKRVRAWYEARADLKNRFGEMFGLLEDAYNQRQELVRADGFFNETFVRGIEIYRIASILNSMPQDADSAQVAATRESVRRFFRDYEPQVDCATMAALLQNYREQVPAQYLPPCFECINSQYGGSTQAYADALFQQSICADSTCIDRLLADSTLRDTDPGLLYAQAIPDKMMDFGTRMKEYNRTINYNERMLTQALLEMEQETPHYSDANFSMRLSYGFIQDYTSQGTHFPYYTNAQSLLDKAAKQDQIEDYRLEENLVSLMQKGNFGRYADKEKRELHLCFISNNDITGGNSGSPMFNGKGELLGLAFDGNWEAMSGDISFDENLQRCIGVDVRFILFLIDKWGKADNLIKELGI